jgi:taurine dioxygenase
VSCHPEPPMGSILYLTTVPPDGGGGTMFANMYRAYQTAASAAVRVRSTWLGVQAAARLRAWREARDARGIPVTSPAVTR